MQLENTTTIFISEVYVSRKDFKPLNIFDIKVSILYEKQTLTSLLVLSADMRQKALRITFLLLVTSLKLKR